MKYFEKQSTYLTKGQQAIKLIIRKGKHTPREEITRAGQLKADVMDKAFHRSIFRRWDKPISKELKNLKISETIATKHLRARFGVQV